MTHIPVGTRLKVTDYVPLPQNRPNVPKTEEMPPVQDLQATIQSTMPLEATEKAADAFKLGGGYHPSSLSEIDLLSLPRASDYNLRGTDLFWSWWERFNPFSFSITEDKQIGYVLNIYNTPSEVVMFLGVMTVVGLIVTLAILGIEKILEYFNIIGKDR